VLRRGFDLFLYRLKRRRGEARNSNLIACISYNSASYFSSNLELDLRLVTVAALYTPLGDVEEIFNPLGVSLGASES
jgi:hypothetical protein